MKSFKARLRPVLFLLVLIAVLIGVQRPFVESQERSYQAIRGFYQEKNVPLDAVYIGGSNVHAFWQPPIGWAEHGIAVWSLSFDCLPPRAVKYLMIEALKTQKDPLFIVNINSFKDTLNTFVDIHRVSDHMLWSRNKVDFLKAVTKDAQISQSDRLEFYFPMLRFHPRWSNLTEWDYHHRVDGLKMGIDYYPYYLSTENITDAYIRTSEEVPLTDLQTDLLTDLIDFCDEEALRVLFVTVPQAADSEATAKQLNAMETFVRGRGYPCLDLLENPEDLDLQTRWDFYNASHTNVHGSIKFIDHLSRYLIDNYGMTDKRGQPGWESWDKAASIYMDRLASYTLPFEWEHTGRDYSLAASKVSLSLRDDGAVDVTWNESEGADGYEIYRKAGIDEYGIWKKIGETEAGTLAYTDTAVPEEADRTVDPENLSKTAINDIAAAETDDLPVSYAIAPYRLADDGGKLYGNFRSAKVNIPREEE